MDYYSYQSTSYIRDKLSTFNFTGSVIIMAFYPMFDSIRNSVLHDLTKNWKRRKIIEKLVNEKSPINSQVTYAFANFE